MYLHHLSASIATRCSQSYDLQVTDLAVRTRQQAAHACLHGCRRKLKAYNVASVVVFASCVHSDHVSICCCTGNLVYAVQHIKLQL
jgi:hypothetical protein